MHLKRNLHDCSARIGGAVVSKIKINRERLNRLSARPVMQSPMNYFAERRMTIDRLSEKLSNLMIQKNGRMRENFSRLAAKLDAMSPLKVLGRGYGFATDNEGKIVKTVDAVKSGDKISMRVQDGKINCTVIDTERSK